MPVEETEITQTAEKLGQLVASHPAVAKFKAAQKAVADDPEASRLLGDFDRQIETLARQEQSGMPVTDAQRQQLESLQSRIVSHLKVKALNLAQVDFMDLMRKVSQTWQRPLADAAGGGGGAGARARPCELFSNAISHRSLRRGNMALWLLKTEPDCYSWDDLTRDKKTVWDGIANALALKYLRTMKKGDLAFVYHTADERSAIGIAEVVSNPYPDPKETDGKLAVVDLKLKKKLKRPVSLDEFKADRAFAGWDLLRISRLSVVPTPQKMWDRVLELAEME